MPANQMDKVLYQVAQARRVGGMAQRHGYVQEVKESSGERKCRIVLGFNKQGEPWLSPWVHTEEHRGGSSSQQLVEKGQAMVYTCHGGDYRNATASPGGESSSNPQPHHAPGFNGDSSQNGAVRTASNKPSSSGGGGTSLLGTTEVLTPDGFKNIKDIVLGDKILSCPTGSATRKPVEDTVIGIQTALTKKSVFDLNYTGGKVCCTGDHGIWTENRSQYVATDRLGFVDKLRDFDGAIVAIVSLIPLGLERPTVYDLTVETNGNFYVRDGSSGIPILVHNANGGSGGGSHTHSTWIDNDSGQNPQHQDQTGTYDQAGGGGGGGQQGGQSSSQSKPDPKIISHLNEDGSWTARNGTECRMMVLDKGSKMKTKQAHAVVTKDGKHIVKKPWIIGKDPFPDQDAV
jgi:hypothetical protein